MAIADGAGNNPVFNLGKTSASNVSTVLCDSLVQNSDTKRTFFSQAC
jgi:hypothetical protein